MNGPVSFKNGLSGALRLGASGIGAFKVRSLRGFPRQKCKEIPSVKILDAAFLLTVGSFLLTVEHFYSQLTILAFLLTVGAFLLTV